MYIFMELMEISLEQLYILAEQKLSRLPETFLAVVARSVRSPSSPKGPSSTVKSGNIRGFREMCVFLLLSSPGDKGP